MTPVTGNGSLKALTQAFSRAADPRLSDLLGTHKGAFAGPWWLRCPAPLLMRVTGMPDWVGKTLRPTDNDTVITGENLIRAGETLTISIPITARLGVARLDRRPAIIVSYPRNAPWPWHHVTDELRPLDEHTLLGLTYGIPATPRAGAPFLLYRQPPGKGNTK